VVPEIYRGKDEQYRNRKVDPEKGAPIYEGKPKGDQDYLRVSAGETVSRVSLEDIEDGDHRVQNSPPLEGNVLQGSQDKPGADGWHDDIPHIGDIVPKHKGAGGQGEFFLLSPNVEDDDQDYRYEIVCGIGQGKDVSEPGSEETAPAKPWDRPQTGQSQS
jgi:hypothetical protein